MKWLVRFFLLLVITSCIILALYAPLLRTTEKSDTLNVFCWGAYLPEEAIAQFQEESSIHVNFSFFTTNEEFLSKIRQSNGKGYDLYICSDYAMKILIDDNLVKPYDQTRTPFQSRIAPFLMHHWYDQESIYSLPFSWEIYGGILNTELVQNQEASLSQIFRHNPTHGNVVMTPDPVEAVIFAAHYLFGHSDNLTRDEVNAVRTLLKQQKQWVEAYTDFRTKYLVATENCPAGLMKTFFLSQIAREYPHVRFVIPKEGTFVSIENFALSATATHDDAAYKFLNFLYRPEIMALQTDEYSLFPSCLDSLSHTTSLPPRFFEVLKEIEARKDFRFFYYILPPDEIREIWVDVKT